MAEEVVFVNVQADEEVPGLIMMQVTVSSPKVQGRKIALGEAVKEFVEKWVKEKANDAPHVFVQDYVP